MDAFSDPIAGPIHTSVAKTSIHSESGERTVFLILMAVVVAILGGIAWGLANQWAETPWEDVRSVSESFPAPDSFTFLEEHEKETFIAFGTNDDRSVVRLYSSSSNFAKTCDELERSLSEEWEVLSETRSGYQSKNCNFSGRANPFSFKADVDRTNQSYTTYEPAYSSRPVVLALPEGTRSIVTIIVTG